MTSPTAGGYNGFLMLGAPMLPLSALGCDNIYYSGFTNAVELRGFRSLKNSWEFKLAVPNDSSLMGAVVTAQTHYLWIPNVFQDLRLTNAVRLTVGR